MSPESPAPSAKPSSPASRPPRRPGRPRTAERSAELRESLLDAATELAIERGFDSVGLREIAERADASAAMISYYFGDKQGLYAAMFDRAFEKMSQQVEALLGPAAPGDAPLDELIHVHVAALAADPWVPRLIAREVLARDTPLRERFRERVHEGPMTVMIRWIEAQKERGYLAGDVDPELTAMSIAALAVFPYLLVPIVGSHIGVELNDEFRDRLVAHNQRLVSHGIRARSGEVA